MPLTVHRRPSGIFHIRGTHFGRRVDRSAGTRVEREARALAAKWEAEIFERELRGDKAVCTFAEAAAGYMRGGGERDHLTPLLAAFGLQRLADIRQADLDALAVSLYPAGKSSTRNRRVYTPFIAIWNWAVDAGLAEPRRWRRPKQPTGRVDWRTPEDIERLINACSPALRALVIFYVGTGARASEAICLDWRDVTPAAQRAVLWETKGGYSRHVDLCDRVRMALPARASGAVFLSSSGEPWHAYDAVNLALKRACVRAGIAHLSCHTLRHTWATWAYAARRDLAWLMAQGGWRSADMAMRYIHLGTDDLAEAVLAHGWEISGKRSATSLKSATQSGS